MEDSGDLHTKGSILEQVDAVDPCRPVSDVSNTQVPPPPYTALSPLSPALSPRIPSHSVIKFYFCICLLRIHLIR